MSKKITLESVSAFLNRYEFKKGNMKVVMENDITYLELHNNRIAALLSDGRMWISNAGWFSNTTKERLNGLPGVGIYQKNGNWILNGNQWDGRPIYVNKI